MCCAKANGHWPFHIIPQYFSALRQLALVHQWIFSPLYTNTLTDSTEKKLPDEYQLCWDFDEDVRIQVEMSCNTVRSGAEERRFWGARLDVLIFRLRSYHVLILYSAECSGPKFHKTLMFLGQAGTFLSFQARRSTAKRSSTSDLTVHHQLVFMSARTKK